MKIVIDIPDGYVGVVMANQRKDGTAMDKLLRQAVIDGKPLSPEIQMILDFIADNYPTEIGTDWERGCAYALDEIEKICKQS